MRHLFHILPLVAAAAVALSACPSPASAVAYSEPVNAIAWGFTSTSFAEQDVSHYESVHGKLPTSTAQARSMEPPNFLDYSSPGQYVQSVSVGPSAGVITVVWGAASELSRKRLVLVPALCDDRQK